MPRRCTICIHAHLVYCAPSHHVLAVINQAFPAQLPAVNPDEPGEAPHAVSGGYAQHRQFWAGEPMSSCGPHARAWYIRCSTVSVPVSGA